MKFLFDPEDIDIFMAYRWKIHLNYVRAQESRKLTPKGKPRRWVHFSREVMAKVFGRHAIDGMFVDHINGDTLDNRRQNLRICTNQQNCRNRTKIQKNNKTGVHGVHKDKRCNVYIASICVHGRPVVLGRFKNLDDAKQARKSAEILYYGEYRAKHQLPHPTQ